jgi:excisionase family DNA binding protein
MQPTDSVCVDRLPGSPWPLAVAAKFLGVSHRHLVRLIDAGKVKSIRLGRRVLIADVELRRVASEGTVP